MTFTTFSLSVAFLSCLIAYLSLTHAMHLSEFMLNIFYFFRFINFRVVHDVYPLLIYMEHYDKIKVSKVCVRIACSLPRRDMIFLTINAA